MPSIDERVVSMAFENAIFEQRVAVTMTTLGKLNSAIAKTGTGPNGLENIEKSASKVTLEAPMSALDKLKAKLGRTNSGTTFTDMERASDKVTLEQPTRALDNLKNKLDRTNAGTTFTDMENAGNRVNLSGLTNALDGIKTHLSGLETAAAVAFGNIASQAVQKGLGFAKGFTFAPIMDGLHEYETNLKAIQTIQANTDQPLTKINKSLEELNRYSDQTIYNFGEMAKNIGTFTAAGVDLKTATSSIKGIANMAALSGSNSQQASTAMYQLSQAIASGKVGLQDWNSVVNAGMGGKKLQSALATTAIAMGDIKESSVKLEGPLKKLTINGQSFRESISAKPGQKPWLSSDVLVNTLATLDGRFSKAALSAELTKDGLKRYTAAQVEAKIATNRTALEQKNGVKYTDAQFAALMKLSDSAFKSATEVKTLGQVFDVAKETIGSGWSASFQNIFGNLKEAKTTFTELSGAINGMINANSLARNKVLHDWKALGGRTDLINGIKNVFHTLTRVLGTVKDAFREVFPAKTGKDLFRLTESFLALSRSLTPSKESLENLKRTLAGVFAVFHIGWTIVKDLGKVFFDLLGIIGKGSGGFLNFTGGIGDFLVGLDKAISKGNALGGFFKGLTNILRVPIELIKGLASGFSNMFSGGGGSRVDQMNELVKFGKVLSPLERGVNSVKEAWKKFSDVFAQFKQMASPWLDQISEVFSNLGNTIVSGIQNADFSKVLLAFQTTFLGGIFLTLKKALGGGKGGFDLTGGVFGQVKDILGGVSNQLTAMQKNVQAGTILKIAGAVAVLAAGIYVISTIEPKRLATAMTAIAVGLGEVGAALKIMSGGGLVGGAEMVGIATGMLILSGAVLVLAGAMKIMSTMSWDEIGRGLAGVGGALTVIGTGLKFINPVSIIPIAAGLVLVGAALVLIASATKIFAEMKWGDMAKGLVGLGGAMLVLAAGLALMGPSILLIGPGLVAAAIGMTLMAGAVSAMGALDPKKMLSGILGLGLALAALGIAITLIPPTVALQAGGLILLGLGLTALAGALSIFGNMKIGTLAKGIISMGLALGVLAVGMALMVGSAAGSASFLLAAAGLAVFVPTLALMGALPWGVILKGLAAMALSMGVIAVVGALAAPGIAALGTSLLILGAALVLIGAAIYLTATGLSNLGDNGVKALGVLVAAITAFIALLPTMVINFVKGLLAIIEEVAKVAPKVVLALGVILDTVIAFIIEQAPKLGMAIDALMAAILTVLANNAGPMITAGWKLIQQLLSGVSNNINSVVTKVGEIITKFLTALSTQIPRIVQAGAKLLGSFLGGIATALPTILASAARVVGKFLTGVTAQIPSVVAKGAKLILTFLNEIIKRVPEFVRVGGRLIVAFINGIGDNLEMVIKAGVRLIKRFMFGIAQAIPDLANSAAKAVIKFINGLAAAIRNNDEQLTQAGLNLASAIVEGMVTGMRGLKNAVIDAAKELASHLPKWVKKVLGIHSPSTVFAEIGKFSVLGLAKGLDANHKPVLNSAGDIGNGLIDKFRDTFQIKSPSKVLKEIGKEVGHGFKDGLDGSADDIRNSFTSLKDKIRTEMGNQRQAINDENTKLRDLQKQHAEKLDEINKLRSAKKPDQGAINAAVKEANDIQKAINASEKAVTKYKGVLGALSGANNSLTRGLQAEKNRLLGLSNAYGEVSKSLDDAKQALQAATQTRDDALKSFADQYSQLPDFGSLLSDAMAEAALTNEERQDKIRKDREERERRSRIDQVANYKKALAEQIAATKQYQATLQKLRELGLDDMTYKKLLAQGLAGQDFATQLLATGKSGITDLNKMDAQLIAESTDLAKQAAYNLYQAGVDAAQGLVDGLTAKKADLEAAMNSLADTIVRRIKSQLGIRSPSKVFEDVGKNAAQGLADGLTGSSSTVASAAADLGDGAAAALTNSLANIGDQVGSEIDTDLTITPVLDLSQVERDASKMHDLTNVVPITAAASYGLASAVSKETEITAEEASAAASVATSVTFEQNNYSPESLSETEIYRQTNNQLAKVKDSLGLNTRISGV